MKANMYTKLPFYIILAILSMCPVSWAETYYVDATYGNDNNNGNAPAMAWKTIAKVNASSFSPGDEILFKQGEIWREQLTVPSSGAVGNAITFGSYGNGTDPIISGADIITGWTLHSGSIYYHSADPVDVWPRSVFVDNVPLTLKGSVGAMEAGTFFVKWEDGVGPKVYVWLSNSSDPSNSTMEIPRRAASIKVTSKDYVTITGLHITKSMAIWPDGALAVNNSNHVTIEKVTSTDVIDRHIWFTHSSDFGVINNNTIYSSVNRSNSSQDFHYTGINIGKHEADAASACTNVTITNNTLYDLFQGIWTNHMSSSLISGNTVYNMDAAGIATFYGSNDVVIENNTVHHTGLNFAMSNGIQTGGNTDGDPVHDIIVRGNEIYNTTHNPGGFDGNGLEIDIGSYNVSAYQNTIYNTHGAGIIVYRAHDNDIYYNIIYNTGNGDAGYPFQRGVIVSRAYDIDIFNNTIYDPNGIGIYLSGIEGDTTFNISVKNNIFSGSVDFAVYVADEYSLLNLSFDYNAWYFTSGKMAYWNTTEYVALSDWQSGQAQDANSINSNPLFTDASGNDFILQATSPCINAGTNVGLTQDYWGNGMIGSSWDIGAYEYKVLAPAPPTNLRIIQP